MAYRDIDLMRQDNDLIGRIAACVAQQGEPQPWGWALDHVWEVCAAPAWDAQWASALAAGKPAPGADGAVISDGDILARVQILRHGLPESDA
jgi:hypothetical protein